METADKTDQGSSNAIPQSKLRYHVLRCERQHTLFVHANIPPYRNPRLHHIRHPPLALPPRLPSSPQRPTPTANLRSRTSHVTSTPHPMAPRCLPTKPSTQSRSSARRSSRATQPLHSAEYAHRRRTVYLGTVVGVQGPRLLKPSSKFPFAVRDRYDGAEGFEDMCNWAFQRAVDDCEPSPGVR